MSRPRVWRPHRQGGFTLVEMLVTLVVGGIFAAGLFAFFFSGVDAARTYESQGRVQADTRLALTRLTREIRQAVSPDGGVTPPIINLTPTEIEFYLDTTRDPGTLVPRPARVRYAIVGTDLIRESAAPIGAVAPFTWGGYVGTDTLLTDVTNGSVPLFAPIDGNGTALGSSLIPPATRAIRQLTVRLLAGYRNGNASRNLELTTDVTLRNPSF